MLILNLESLKRKEVVDIQTGERLGFIDDAEINIKTSETIALIIYGRERFFGLFGKEENIVIPCDNIEVVGEEIILIKTPANDFCAYSTKKNKFCWKNLFS